MKNKLNTILEHLKKYKSCAIVQKDSYLDSHILLDSITRKQEWSSVSFLCVDTNYEYDQLKAECAIQGNVVLLDLVENEYFELVQDQIEVFVEKINVFFSETPAIGAFSATKHFIIVTDSEKYKNSAYCQKLKFLFDCFSKMIYLKLAIHDYGRHQVSFYFHNVHYLYEYQISDIVTEVYSLASNLFKDYQIILYFDHLLNNKINPIGYEKDHIYIRDILTNNRSNAQLEFEKINFNKELDLILDQYDRELTIEELQYLHEVSKYKAKFISLLRMIPVYIYEQKFKISNILSWCNVGKVLLGLIFLLTIFDIQPYRLIYNETASMPVGFYLVDQSKHVPELGDAVIFDYPEPVWAFGRYNNEKFGLLKQVYATPHEYLMTADQTVYACNPGLHTQCRPLGINQLVDSQGRKMYPIEWKNEEIPANYYYVSSPSEKSLNSSYYGLISTKQIKGLAYPIWVKS